MPLLIAETVNELLDMKPFNSTTCRTNNILCRTDERIHKSSQDIWDR